MRGSNSWVMKMMMTMMMTVMLMMMMMLMLMRRCDDSNVKMRLSWPALKVQTEVLSP